MRKLTIAAMSGLIGGLVVLSACGGGASGSSGNSDTPLGDVAGIFVEVAKKRGALNEDLRKGNYSVERHQKKLKDFDEYAAKSYEKAAKEGAKLVGREIVFSGDVYPDFQVTGAKIGEYMAGTESGNVIVRVTVTPKRDIIVRKFKHECAAGEYSLKETFLYFALMKADDHLIELGQLNPFNSNPYNGSLKAEYGPGDMIQAGVPCHSEGAPVYISLHIRDFTEFAKIVFFREEDYMAIRKQAYGF